MNKKAFKLNSYAFILHPSALIPALEPVAQRKEERKYAKLEVARSNRARFISFAMSFNWQDNGL
jgi:hypothetical protein